MMVVFGVGRAKDRVNGVEEMSGDLHAGIFIALCQSHEVIHIDIDIAQQLVLLGGNEGGLEAVKVCILVQPGVTTGCVNIACRFRAGVELKLVVRSGAGYVPCDISHVGSDSSGGAEAGDGFDVPYWQQEMEANEDFFVWVVGHDEGLCQSVLNTDPNTYVGGIEVTEGGAKLHCLKESIKGSNVVEAAHHIVKDRAGNSARLWEEASGADGEVEQ
eukprot:540346-Ditylum_brightwellii.AAC.1